MAVDTKPNLTSAKFEQCEGDVLALSGDTNVFGTFELASGATLSIISNRGVGKVLTSDINGFATWQTPAAAGGSGERLSKSISQANSFVVGEVIGWSGGTYNLAIADGTYDGEILGIVTKAGDPFELTQAGYVTGLTSLSANTTYFLSTTIAGSLTDALPIIGGNIVKSVLIADTTTSGWVLPYPAYILSTGSTGGGTITGGTNGLGVSGANITLGGTLLQSTIIGINNQCLAVTGNSLGCEYGLYVCEGVISLGDYLSNSTNYIIIGGGGNPYIDQYIIDSSNTGNSAELYMQPQNGNSYLYQDSNGGSDYGCLGLVSHCLTMSSTCGANSCSSCLGLTPTSINLGSPNSYNCISIDSSGNPYIDLYVNDAFNTGNLAEIWTDAVNGTYITQMLSDTSKACIDLTSTAAVSISSYSANTNCSSICIGTGEMLISGYNLTGFSGMRYAGDYSANYQCLSIPNAGWVTGQTGGGGTITGATNGLNINSAKQISLGGTLTGDTTINTDNGCICFTNTTSCDSLHHENAYTDMWHYGVSASGEIYTDAGQAYVFSCCNAPESIESEIAVYNGCNCLYSCNYSTSWFTELNMNPSGITVCGLPARTTEICAVYIDALGALSTGVVSGSTGSGFTIATNGLNSTGNSTTVCLGGTLVQDTVIETDANYFAICDIADKMFIEMNYAVPNIRLGAADIGSCLSSLSIAATGIEAYAECQANFMGFNYANGFTFEVGNKQLCSVPDIGWITGHTANFSEFTITGDSSTTGFTVNHAKNKQFVGVEVVRNSAPYPTVYTNVERTDANNVYVSFDTAPASGLQYKILIIS